MSETKAETPLAPSDTAKTETISQRRSTRSRRDRSGASSGRVRRSHAPVRNDGSCSAAAAEGSAWLREERVEIAVLRAADQRLNLSLGVDEGRAAGVRRVAHGDLAVGQPGHLHAGV